MGEGKEEESEGDEYGWCPFYASMNMEHCNLLKLP
jgi:hypothetical protein